MSKVAPCILLVDDEPLALKCIRASLAAEGLHAKILTAPSTERAKELFVAYAPQVVVTDLCIEPLRGPSSGFELLSSLKRLGTLPFRTIVLTGFDDSKNGIRALELGAAHFITKPPDPHHLKIIIEDAITQSNILREKKSIEENLLENSTLIGSSPEMKKLREELSLFARSNLPVLLLGEPGTGKTLCAKELHRLSPQRSRQRCIKYQPGLTSAELVASDLFGHIRGSFTGAEQGRRGLIAEANGGTFFLDEIDALPLNVQALLLGVLQEGTLRALGANEEDFVDVRFIGATNKNIAKLLSQGILREDFLGRLSHLVLELPPLRSRTEDIALISINVLQRAHDLQGSSVFDLSPPALQKLHGYNWPGNIRELEGVVERAALMANAEGARSIEARHIKLSDALISSSPKNQIVLGYEEEMRRFEREIIVDALSRCSGNQSEAARVLRMDRHTLRRIVLRQGLS